MSKKSQYVTAGKELIETIEEITIPTVELKPLEATKAYYNKVTNIKTGYTVPILPEGCIAMFIPSDELLTKKAVLVNSKQVKSGETISVAVWNFCDLAHMITTDTVLGHIVFLRRW